MSDTLTIMAVASAGLQAIGPIAQGQAASRSAKYNEAVANNNAQIATQNAAFAGAEGNQNVENQEYKTRANVGAIKVGQAAGGIDVNTGSAAKTQVSADTVGQLDAANIRAQAARSAYGFQTQAASDTAQAALDKAQAKYSSESGYLGAATSLLGAGVSGIESGLLSDPFAAAGNASALNTLDQGDVNFLNQAQTSAGLATPTIPG